jgi:hypothetical protein
MDSLIISVGLALHNPVWSEPEINLEPVVGVVQVDRQLTNRVKLSFTHISGIKTREEGLGLNMLGLMYTFK